MRTRCRGMSTGCGLNILRGVGTVLLASYFVGTAAATAAGEGQKPHVVGLGSDAQTVEAAYGAPIGEKKIGSKIFQRFHKTPSGLAEFIFDLKTGKAGLIAVKGLSVKDMIEKSLADSAQGSSWTRQGNSWIRSDNGASALLRNNTLYIYESEFKKLVGKAEDGFETVLNIEATASTNSAKPKMPTSDLDTLKRKLEEIVIDHIEFEEVSIQNIINYLRKRSRDLDPEGKGINIILNLKGQESSDKGANEENDHPITIVVDKIPLKEAIEYITRGAGLKWRIFHNAVEIASKDVPFDAESIALTKSFINPPPNQELTAKMNAKLDNLKIDRVEFEDAALSGVLSYLKRETQRIDPEGLGIAIILRTTPAQAQNLPRVSMALNAIAVRDVIECLCQVTGLSYRIEERAVVIGDSSSLE